MAPLSTVGTEWGLEYTIVGVYTLSMLLHAVCCTQHASDICRSCIIYSVSLPAECPKKHHREVVAVFPGLDPEGSVRGTCCMGSCCFALAQHLLIQPIG